MRAPLQVCFIRPMARREKPLVRRVSIDRMLQSFERTLRAENRSEKTVYSYGLSARLLSEFLAARGTT